LHALETSHSLEVGDGVFVAKRIVRGVNGDPSNIAVSFEWSDEKGEIRRQEVRSMGRGT
jgi:hypothetical protein